MGLQARQGLDQVVVGACQAEPSTTLHMATILQVKQLVDSTSNLSYCPSRRHTGLLFATFNLEYSRIIALVQAGPPTVSSPLGLVPLAASPATRPPRVQLPAQPFNQAHRHSASAAIVTTHHGIQSACPANHVDVIFTTCLDTRHHGRRQAVDRRLPLQAHRLEVRQRTRAQHGIEFDRQRHPYRHAFCLWIRRLCRYHSGLYLLLPIHQSRTHLPRQHRQTWRI